MSGSHAIQSYEPDGKLDSVQEDRRGFPRTHEMLFPHGAMQSWHEPKKSCTEKIAVFRPAGVPEAYGQVARMKQRAISARHPVVILAVQAGVGGAK